MNRAEVVDRLMWEFAGSARPSEAAVNGWDNGGMRDVCQTLLEAYEQELPEASFDDLWIAAASDLGASCMVHSLAVRLSRHCQVWRYQFEGFGGVRSSHGVDRDLVVGGACGTVELEVQRSLVSALASFAVCGDPNTGHAFGCRWEPYVPLSGHVLRIASQQTLIPVGRALQHCVEVVEDLCRLRQKASGRLVGTVCAECGMRSQAPSALGGKWLCRGCWRGRQQHPQRGMCAECGALPPSGQESLASFCKNCAGHLRPRDLRWREAASVYWVQPDAPQGLLACASCNARTDVGRWVGVVDGLANMSRQVWHCHSCSAIWSAGSLDRPSTEAIASQSLLAVASRATLVSLGSWCGVKAALRGLGAGGATMPFDWIRISLAGLLQALRTDFAEFLDSPTTTRFFHDVLEDKRDIDKYLRRFRRFRELRNTREMPLIFVRALDTTAELMEAVVLYDLLVGFFDASVYLLLLLDHQLADLMVFFDERHRLLVCTIDESHVHPREYEIDRQPFVTAYHWALRTARWHATCGWLPQETLRLKKVSDLFHSIRQQSLGENLERYNYGIPQMPPDSVLLQIMNRECPSRRAQTIAAVRSRMEWECATGHRQQYTEVVRHFLCWMCEMAE